jgi:hypothetical protein
MDKVFGEDAIFAGAFFN